MSLLTTEETDPSAENINKVIQELSGLKNQAWAGAR
jgi:hypothetical protein